MGRRVRCTPDHGWIVGDGHGGEASFKLAEDLTEHDWVPIALGRGEEWEPTRVASLLSAAEAAELSPEQLIVRPRREHIEELVRRPIEERRQVFTRAGSVAARTGEVRRTGTLRLGEVALAGLPLDGLDDQHDEERQPAPERASAGRALLAGGRALPSGGLRLRWAQTNGRSSGTSIQPAKSISSTRSLPTGSARTSAPGRPHGHRTDRDRLVPTGRDLVHRGAGARSKRLRTAVAGHDLGAAGLGQVGASVGPVRRRRLVVSDQRRPERDHRAWNRQRRARRRSPSFARRAWDRRVAADRTNREVDQGHALDPVAGADQVERAIELVPKRDRPGVLASIARQQKRIAPTGYRRFGDGVAWVRVTSTERQPTPALSTR